MQNKNLHDAADPTTTDNSQLNPESDMFPNEMPQQVRELLSSWMLSLRSEHRSNASLLVEKLDPEHISTIIANGAKEDERNFSAFKLEKIVGIIILIVALVFALTVLLLFRDSEYFVALITALFSFLGGLGVGKLLLSGKRD
jgi:hypothetical protein